MRVFEITITGVSESIKTNELKEKKRRSDYSIPESLLDTKETMDTTDSLSIIEPSH